MCVIKSQTVLEEGNLNNTESTKITDLNEDCLYETLIHLNADDLNNIVNTNRRFRAIAHHLFGKRLVWIYKQVIIVHSHLL